MKESSKVRIIILDWNRAYAKRLRECFLERHGDMVEVFLATTGEEVIMYVREAAESMSVILIDESFCLDGIEELEGVGMLYLVAEPDIGYLDDCPAICRYTDVEEIYNQLLFVWMDAAAEWAMGLPDQLAKTMLRRLTRPEEDRVPIFGADTPYAEEEPYDGEPENGRPLGSLEVMIRTRKEMESLLDTLAPQVRLVVVYADAPEKEGDGWDSFGASREGALR